MDACGAFALIGFPLDDVWHRLFGQDVTLWGPTHLMLIGGAGMSLVGMAVLLSEGMPPQGPFNADASVDTFTGFAATPGAEVTVGTTLGTVVTSQDVDPSVAGVGIGSVQAEDKVVKVGVLHSLSGTMAISETALKDVALMTIDEIN